MPSWFGKLRYAWRRHGPTRLLWLIAYNIVYHIPRLVYRINRQPSVDQFDRQPGPDTGGRRRIASLDVLDLPAAVYAAQYEPSGVELVNDELDKLNVDAAQFTFIDFGSGKGRVLLIAAARPFREVIGI